MMTAEKSLYERPKMLPLMRYHLNGIIDVMKDRKYPLNGIEFRFIDSDGWYHVYSYMCGEWREGDTIR